MIELGYAKKINAVFTSIDFPRQLLGELEIGLVQHFMGWEKWESMTLLERIEARKGMLVHYKKVSEIYNPIFIEYVESIIKMSDLILNFLLITNSFFSNTTHITIENVNLLRFHALLYCELYAIHKEEDIKAIKHILNDQIIGSLFDKMKDSKFYNEYNIEEIVVENQNLMRLYDKQVWRTN